MEIRADNGVVYVSGDITESCSQEMGELPAGPVRMDMSAVRSINSSGVREWIAAIGRRGVVPTYVRCSPAVVMQFNMVEEFLEGGAKVESIIVPAFSPKSGVKYDVLFVQGEDFTPGQGASEISLDKLQRGSEHLEPDVDLDTYLFFIEELRA